MSDLHDAVVLISGGAGFCGANLGLRLAGMGARVHAFTRPGGTAERLADAPPSLTLHHVDITDAAAVLTLARSVRPDYVVHAAITAGHPRDAAGRRAQALVGVIGMLNLIEAALEAGCARFLNVGSSLEYGPRARPLREEDALQPTTFRGSVKASAALIGRVLATQAGLDYVLVRPFSVYGPHEASHRFIPTVLRAVRSGDEINLTAQDARHDFIFVEDVVDACLAALTTPDAKGQAFNVGRGEEWSNAEVAELAQQVAGRRVRVNLGSHPAHVPDTRHWVADVSRARRVLGWSPQTDLRAGLARFLAWMDARAT